MLSTGGFGCGTPARYGDHRRLPSIRVGLIYAEAPESVFAHWRSVEAWYRNDPSLRRWRLTAHPELRSVARTSPRRDETVVALCFLFFCDLHLPMGSARFILVAPGEAESGSAGVQPERGIARPTAYREVPSSGGPTMPPEFFCPPLGRRRTCLENAPPPLAYASVLSLVLRLGPAPWFSVRPPTSSSP